MILFQSPFENFVGFVMDEKLLGNGTKKFSVDSCQRKVESFQLKVLPDLSFLLSTGPVHWERVWRKGLGGPGQGLRESMIHKASPAMVALHLQGSYLC